MTAAEIALVHVILERMKLAVVSLVELNNRLIADDRVPLEYTEELMNILKRFEIPEDKDRR